MEKNCGGKYKKMRNQSFHNLPGTSKDPLGFADSLMNTPVLKGNAAFQHVAINIARIKYK